MKKKEVEKKLKALAKKMQSTYLEYLDSLEEEGNKIGKEEGYISIAIFRDSVNINTTRVDTELKAENQIDLFWVDK
jgi:hypothetical protein